MDISDVETVFQTLSSYEGVEGIVVAEEEGLPIRTTLDEGQSCKYGNLSARAIHQAASYLLEVRSTEQLQHIRIRGKQTEIIIAPSSDGSRRISLTVIQRFKAKHG